MAYRIIHFRSLSLALSFAIVRQQTVAATHNIHTISSWFDDDDVQLIFFFSQKKRSVWVSETHFFLWGFLSHVYYEKKDSRHPPTTFLFAFIR